MLKYIHFVPIYPQFAYINLLRLKLKSLSWGVPVVQLSLMFGRLGSLIPLSCPVGRKADVFSDTAALSKAPFFFVINKRAGAGQPRAALPLWAATSLRTSPVSCRLGELELATQVTLSDMLPETHALFIDPMKYSVYVWCDMQFRWIQSHFTFLNLFCLCCKLNSFGLCLVFHFRV